MMPKMEQNDTLAYSPEITTLYRNLEECCALDTDEEQGNENLSKINESIISDGGLVIMFEFKNALNTLRANIQKLFKIQFIKYDINFLTAKTTFFRILNKCLKGLKSPFSWIMNEGIFNMYLEMSTTKKQYIRKNLVYESYIYACILEYMEESVKLYIVIKEVKKYQKKNWLISDAPKSKGPNSTKTISNSIEQKIKEKFLKKSCHELLEDYLKKEEAKLGFESCRICCRQIDLDEIKYHMEICSKRQSLEQQIRRNLEQRLKYIQNLKILIEDLQEQSQDMVYIEQLINFYDSKTNTKRRRRSSATHLDQKNNIQLSLYFMKKQANSNILCKNQALEENLAKIKSLQDRAYCLSKKKQGLTSSNENSINLFCSNYCTNKKNLTHLCHENFQVKIVSVDSDQSMMNNNSSISQDLLDQQNELSTNNDSENQLLIVPRMMKKYSEYYPKRGSNCESISEASCEDLSLRNFQILSLLGKGAFSKVYLVRKKRTQDLYALKMIIMKEKNKSQEEGLRKQYKIYKKIEGEHLVAAPYCFQQNSGLFFVLEYMPGGDLSKILEQNVYLQEKPAKIYLAEIILALEHLHKFSIVHRDIKPQNIVLNGKGHLKLTDFGLSEMKIKEKITNELQIPLDIPPERCLKLSQKKSSILRSQNQCVKLIGTPDYIPPEIIKGESYDNASIDWWSLGVIIYQMLIGCRPFSANSIDEVITNILKGEIQLPEIGYEQDMISPEAADLIQSLLNPNHKQRLGSLGASQIKNHPFFKQIDWIQIKKQDPPEITPKKRRTSEFLQGENSQLRSQIQRQIAPQKSDSPRMLQLQNYARYDLLINMSTIEQKVRCKKERLAKIREIVNFVQ